MSFDRHRRLRINPLIRDLVRETFLLPQDLIQPVFIHESLSKKREISSMPGQFQYPVTEAAAFIREAKQKGIRYFMLFGIPGRKDAKGSGAYSPKGIIQKALRLFKKEIPDCVFIADTCLCEYTSNGQCGIYHNSHLDNDLSLDLISKTALSQAKAGADIIAPSVMIDGMVSRIRDILDRNRFVNLPILSYAVKYASAFYGPFREAAGSGDNFCGDRKNHQMDPANGREALREAQSDIREGADILMVKPAMAYLDIIASLKNKFNKPLCAYNVSGEYAMIKAAANAGLIDEEKIVKETLTSIKRAGADMIITYHADFIVDKLLQA